MGHLETIFGTDFGMGYGPTETQNIIRPRGSPRRLTAGGGGGGGGVAQGGVEVPN